MQRMWRTAATTPNGQCAAHGFLPRPLVCGRGEGGDLGRADIFRLASGPGRDGLFGRRGQRLDAS